MEAFTMKMI